MALTSNASNLVANDTNANFDAFVSAPDTDSPVITKPPTPRLVAKTSAGPQTIPVTVSWLAKDQSGICTYALAESVGGGEYQAVPLSAAAVTSKRFAYPVGANTRQYRLDATDCAGNAPSQAAGPVFTTARYQEGNAHITYSGVWHRGSSPAYVGGHDRYTKQRGASAKVSFAGPSVAWVAPTSELRGSANVFIDGVKVAKVNLGTARAHERRLVYAKTFATSGAHTLRIRTLSGRRVDLDEILIIV